MKDYLEHFEAIVVEQKARVIAMKEQADFIDYKSLDKIIIGVVGGDGIGPTITGQAQRVLEYLLKSEVELGKIEFRIIEGLTIEKRAEVNKAIPEDVLEQIKRCHVILKGPTTTPRQGDEWPNIESANVAMRKELDLFANVRPVKVEEDNIDWVFFRENTEGAYVLGSKGVQIDEDIAIDFKVITTEGSRRIAKAAFEFAAKNGRTRVTCITKANVVKATDGKFLEVCKEVSKDYEGIELDDWYIDIMTAKLIDKNRRSGFQVMVLPNLYGDILTDEAAEFQGGVGTAGSANIGKRYAMFEAIHGSAPRMVKEGRDIYADPSSVVRGGAMLLSHIGYENEADKLFKALDICGRTEKKLVMTGRDTGATNSEFADYLMETIEKL